MDSAIAKALQLRQNLPALSVAVVGSWVWVSGNTIEFRAALRGHGLRWAPEKGKWYWKPAGAVSGSRA